jgi:NADPH:quinone reductase
VLSKPDINVAIGRAIDELIAAGAVSPIVGARFPLKQAADALDLIDGRGATGKVVLDVVT